MSKTLSSQANAVLQEFGGVLPDAYLSFEDAQREYLYVRALELQRLGMAATNKTVTSAELSVSTREGLITMPDGVNAIIPAAVEFLPTAGTFGRDNKKVSIVSVDQIPGQEGNRAIAFWDTPMKYRLSWDSWLYGTLYMYYDPVLPLEPEADECIVQADCVCGTGCSGGCNPIRQIVFPEAFWTLLIKKTAFNVIDIVRLKAAYLASPDEKDLLELTGKALSGLEQKLALQVEEWQREFRRWVNQDLNQTAYVRRTQMEIMARDYHSSGNRAFDSWE